MRCGDASEFKTIAIQEPFCQVPHDFSLSVVRHCRSICPTVAYRVHFPVHLPILTSQRRMQVALQALVAFHLEIKKDVPDLAVTPTAQGLQTMRGVAETSLENGRRIDTFYWQK